MWQRMKAEPVAGWLEVAVPVERFASGADSQTSDPFCPGGAQATEEE